MDTSFRFLPPQASTLAPQHDALFYYLTAVTVFFTLLVFVLVVFMALVYRRRSPNDRPARTVTDARLEVAWSVIPLMIVLVAFAWGAKLYVHASRIPDDAMELSVVGKQWMWKVQHPTGRREINEMHVPTGRPVSLRMISEDVIHDFSVPAFRMKADVVPGSYRTQWFQATTPGEYRLFCAEYCGNQHAAMGGRVVVMEPAAYEAWLQGAVVDEPPAVAGAKLFAQYSCASCHGQRAPSLSNIYNKDRWVIRAGERVQVRADDLYLRRAILQSSAELVEGYGPLMPTFKGVLSEEQTMQLVSYIKSLSGVGPAQNERLSTPNGHGQQGPEATDRNWAVPATRPESQPGAGM